MRSLLETSLSSNNENCYSHSIPELSYIAMLDSLHIHNFRCFSDLKIPVLGRINLITGKNNIGKSSLLEAMAIYAIGQNISKTQSMENLLESIVGVIAKRRGYDHLGVAQEFVLLLHKQIEHGIYIGSTNRDNYTSCKFKEFDKASLSEGTMATAGLRLSINKKDYDYLILKDFSVTLRDTPTKLDFYPTNSEKRNYSFCESNISSENKLDELLDKVKQDGNKKDLIQYLRIVEPNIEDIDFIKGNQQNRAGIITLKNQKPFSLKTMGEGMTRILQLFLHAYQARGGYLLIDEFENGLHYSIQQEVWQKLFILAKELDIQVFVTTHSKDSIQTFCQVANREEDINGQLIGLARSARKSDKDQIIAISYSEQELQRFLESDMEVRG